MNNETDMRPAIVAKSDQLNAEDLMAGPITVTISNAYVKPSTDQPVIINYEGDNGKPYKPCKSMCRVLVHAWGADSSNYAKRGMTLFLDPSVKWGGIEVGGIRISHLSHIEKDMSLPITFTRGVKKPYSVKKLQDASPADPDAQRAQWVANYIAKANSIESLDAFTALQDEQKSRLDQFRDGYPEFWSQISEAHQSAMDRLDPQEDDEE